MGPASTRPGVVLGSPAQDPGVASVVWWSPGNRRSVERREWWSAAVWAAALGAVAVAILLARVWVRLQVVEAGYRVSVVRQLVERLEEERGELRVRAAATDTPLRLERLARERLEMRAPAPGEEVFVP